MMSCLRASGLRIGLAPSLISGCGREHTDRIREFKSRVRHDAARNNSRAVALSSRFVVVRMDAGGRVVTEGSASGGGGTTTGEG